jgi:hypothetical protein
VVAFDHGLLGTHQLDVKLVQKRSPSINILMDRGRKTASKVTKIRRHTNSFTRNALQTKQQLLLRTSGNGRNSPFGNSSTIDGRGFPSVTIAAASLDAGTGRRFTKSVGWARDHTHMIAITVADLAAIKAGGSNTVTSTKPTRTGGCSA